MFKKILGPVLDKILGSSDNKIYKSLDEIKKGSGGLVKEASGEVLAVYKDEKGVATKLSPKCTHMGCTVEWVEESKEWYCPCHKSKFSKEGKVVKGLAKKDLEKIVIE